MIRTRDFLLFLVTVGFLLLAIVVTAREDGQTPIFTDEVFIDNDEVIYEAVVPEDEPDKRSERLDELRKKISKLDIIDKNLASVITSNSEEIKESEKEESEEDTLFEAAGGSVVDVCNGYGARMVNWSPANLQFEVVEGARLIYRETDNFSGASSTQNFEREIVLQLPMRLTPNSTKKCLTDDVIGVALDGSLIRNNEYGVYGIFGAETLVGYALDGFPIYGLNDLVETDSCGGVTELGQYRYYLSSEREGVIGCYSGLPAVI